MPPPKTNMLEEVDFQKVSEYRWDLRGQSMALDHHWFKGKPQDWESWYLSSSSSSSTSPLCNHLLSAISQVPGAKKYEIVFPQKLHTLHKRDVKEAEEEANNKEEIYQSEVQYRIKLHGEDIVLHLQKNKNLLSPDYTETLYSSTGERITTSPQLKEHCYYQGHIINEKDSAASISTCDGLRGYFKHYDQSYLIEPLKLTDQEEHAVYKYEHKELNRAKRSCGMKHSGSKNDLIRTPRAVKSQEEQAFLQSEKFIELYLVLDNAFYKSHKENQTVIRTLIFDVMNLLNVIYNTIKVHVALTGFEIWNDADKIKVVQNSGELFANFLDWCRRDLLKRKAHDHAQFLTGLPFNQRLMGAAASNSICLPTSVSIIEALRKGKFSLVGIMSHELGHVLGMPDLPHTTKCPSGSCAMNQYLSSKFPKDFSPSCRSHFEKFLLSNKPKCLLNVPAPESIITNPICGNGILERGEDCDCGAPEGCSNPCCEAKTCKLKSQASCKA
ncbi:ADAM DEC1-like [Tachyglossus aculeatus]|uniref:ADAM DEC1-like n=1 Tax=Tachyglossus aculeatus TaxID=9261 RepID=UPI0018F718F9|nr:ADAM DEC1-like [Tachyglossus aculeatus]